MDIAKVAKGIIAGAMKRVLENISVEMGHGGGINDEVMAEGRRRQKLGLPPFAPSGPVGENAATANAPALAEGLRGAAGRLDSLRDPPGVADPMAEYRRLLAVESDLIRVRGLIDAFLARIGGGGADETSRPLE